MHSPHRAPLGRFASSLKLNNGHLGTILFQVDVDLDVVHRDGSFSSFLAQPEFGHHSLLELFWSSSTVWPFQPPP